MYMICLEDLVHVRCAPALVFYAIVSYLFWLTSVFLFYSNFCLYCPNLGDLVYVRCAPASSFCYSSCLLMPRSLMSIGSKVYSKSCIAYCSY